MQIGQTGLKRVNLTQMIRKRNIIAGLAEEKKQVEKRPKIKSDFMFQKTSRDSKYLSFYPNSSERKPVVGQYNPRFESLHGKVPAYKIQEEKSEESRHSSGSREALNSSQLVLQ